VFFPSYFVSLLVSFIFFFLLFMFYCWLSSLTRADERAASPRKRLGHWIWERSMGGDMANYPAAAEAGQIRLVDSGTPHRRMHLIRTQSPVMHHDRSRSGRRKQIASVRWKSPGRRRGERGIRGATELPRTAPPGSCVSCKRRVANRKLRGEGAQVLVCKHRRSWRGGRQADSRTDRPKRGRVWILFGGKKRLSGDKFPYSISACQCGSPLYNREYLADWRHP